MIHLILKNLWKQSSRNGWLILELIIVAVILRQTLDPFIVDKYIQSLPVGFPTERLYYLPYRSIYKSHPDYRPLDDKQRSQNLRQAIEILGKHKDIEVATAFTEFASLGNSSYNSQSFIIDTVHTPFSIKILHYLPNSNFFQTFGFNVLEGETAYSLDQKELNNREIVITDLFNSYFKNGCPLTGQKLFLEKDALVKGNYDKIIVGCVQHVRSNLASYYEPLMFTTNTNDFVSSNCTLVFRLKKDVSPTKFETEFPDWAKEHLNLGNFRPSNLQSFQQEEQEFLQQSGYNSKNNIQLILTVFLLINVFLGVTGTFWIQTQKRHEEIGIMLSYGGKPRSIIRMLLIEGAVLCTVCVVIGCLICLQYILVTQSTDTASNVFGPYSWIDIFPLRFVIISIATYLIMLFCVLLGVYIPSKKISKMQICDALYNE